MKYIFLILLSSPIFLLLCQCGEKSQVTQSPPPLQGVTSPIDPVADQEELELVFYQLDELATFDRIVEYRVKNHSETQSKNQTLSKAQKQRAFFCNSLINLVLGTDLEKTNYTDYTTVAKQIGIELKGDFFLAQGEQHYAGLWLYATKKQHREFSLILDKSTTEICKNESPRYCYEISLQEFDNSQSNGVELARRYIYLDQVDNNYTDPECSYHYSQMRVKLKFDQKEKLSLTYRNPQHDVSHSFDLTSHNGSPQTHFFPKEQEKKHLGVSILRHKLNHRLSNTFITPTTKFDITACLIKEAKSPHRQQKIAYSQPVPPDLIERITNEKNTLPLEKLSKIIAKRHQLEIQDAYNITEIVLGMNVPKDELSYIFFLPEISQIISSAQLSATHQIREIFMPWIDIFPSAKVTASLYFVDAPKFGKQFDYSKIITVKDGVRDSITQLGKGEDLKFEKVGEIVYGNVNVCTHMNSISTWGSFTIEELFYGNNPVTTSIASNTILSGQAIYIPIDLSRHGKLRILKLEAELVWPKHDERY